MEKTIEEIYPIPENPNSFSFCNSFVNILQRKAFKRGYTTRNDEVVKMVESMIHDDFNTTYVQGYNQAMNDILTKLKEDSK